MSKFEFVSPEGLRMDGRRPGELRRIEAKMGVVSKADGSALFRQGNTQVLVTIYGPKEVCKHKFILKLHQIISNLAPLSTIAAA
jgi:exosome complex component RRP41